MPSETQTVETENGLEEIEVKPQITRDNPADIVNATRGFSVLKLVVKDMDKLSRQKITPSNYVTAEPFIQEPESKRESIIRKA